MKDTSSRPEAAWRVPSLGVDQLLGGRGTRVIDLRSPAEFAEDHVPGACNLPLFDDLERALVGTIYKRRSPADAFDQGIELLRSRIAPLVTEIAERAGRPAPEADLVALLERLTAAGLDRINRALETAPAAELPEGALLLYCWRGGLRSSSVVVLLRELGWRDVFVLEGGYKGYRRHVMGELEVWCPPPVFVLRGRTGVGKTLVLRELEARAPGLTLDLEGLAGHRSSILGMVGLEPCPQKTFDSRLATRLRAGFPGRLVVEGESRKVGDTILPRSVWEALQGGVNLQLEAPVEHRVQVLIDDYLAREENREELRAQLPFIEGRLGQRKWRGELVRLLDERRDAELVEVLLERYYDPLYAHSEEGRTCAATFDTSDLDRVATELLAWIDGARLPIHGR